jgi:hypothetical protein
MNRPGVGQIKAKRNKAYRPKHIQVPVMPDLQKEFIWAGHAALTTLRLAPTTDAFDQLADLFNVISVALQDTGGNSVILHSGMRSLQDVCDRAERTGRIGISRFELPPIENAVIECESIVKQLDVMRLHHARIKTTHAARLARALNNQPNLKELAA